VTTEICSSWLRVGGRGGEGGGGGGRGDGRYAA